MGLPDLGLHHVVALVAHAHHKVEGIDALVLLGSLLLHVNGDEGASTPHTSTARGERGRGTGEERGERREGGRKGRRGRKRWEGVRIFMLI